MSPLPPGPYYPTNGLVAVAWLGQRVPGLTPAMVATSLPRKVTDWADLGFVQATVITGTPDVDVPIRRPLIQVDCWAASVDSSGTVSTRPPVHKAARLAELVRTATELDTARYSSPLEMPANYAGAIALSAYVRSEPAEIPDDPSGYARMTFDLVLEWARA